MHSSSSQHPKVCSKPKPPGQDIAVSSSLFESSVFWVERFVLPIKKVGEFEKFAQPKVETMRVKMWWQQTGFKWGTPF